MEDHFNIIALKSRLARRTTIYFHSPRTHWLRCPVDMIDRTAEGLHCGELGQGVAVLFLPIVLILLPLLFSGFSDSFYHLAVNYQNHFLSLFAAPSQLFVLLFVQLRCGHPHIKVTWSFTRSYLNVSPQLTPGLLSTELQYSLLMQIILNPPIAAVSRKS